MVAIPQGDDGLGLILLNSNAEANFSFTNALGLVSAEDTLALLAIARTFPAPAGSSRCITIWSSIRSRQRPFPSASAPR